MIPRHSGQTNIGVIILLMLLALFFPLAAYLGLRIELSIVFILAVMIFCVSFIRMDLALIILIFAMLLSPEIKAGEVTGRTVKIRADDVFLMVIFIGWVARMAINKELGFFRVTPINRPLQVYMLICLVATAYGAVRGFVEIKAAMFYFLKYFEYYLLFFLVANIIKNRKEAKAFIYCLIFVSLIISIYAWHQHASGIERVSTPFENPEMGESNTLGGYLVLLMSIVAGLALNTRWAQERVAFSVILALSFPALLFTLSRGSWLAFFASVATLFFLTRKGKAILIVGALVMALLLPILAPKTVHTRLRATFVGEKKVQIFNISFKLDESAMARIETWRVGLARWRQSPLIGKGVSSAGPAFDNQYTRILIETGLLGLAGFFWILWALARYALFLRREYWNDRFAVGLIAGFLAGLAGLMIHCFSAATFIIIKIMEPFWFLAALVVMLPELPPEHEAVAYDE